jgi:hypothetical protein
VPPEDAAEFGAFYRSQLAADRPFCPMAVSKIYCAIDVEV